MKSALLLFLIAFYIESSYAQNIIFRSISTDQGLLHTYVNDLYQDENHLIWIGTYKGLNCYDGKNILDFKKFEGSFNRKYSNYVQSICGDKNGKVFIAYNHLVAEYDISKDEFHILLESENINTVFYEDYLYIGKENKVITYDAVNKEFKPVFVFPDPSLSVTKIFLDKSKRLWVGTNKGLFRLNKSRLNLEKVIQQGIISDIFEDSKGIFWVGTWEHGLFKISKTKEQFTHIPSDPHSISSNFVRCISEDDFGNYWIGTINGLNKLDDSKKTFKKYEHDASSGGITSSSIWCILKDHQGTMWIGTYFGGIDYFNPRYEVYKHYKESKVFERGLSSPIIGRIVKDDKDNLWIGTEGGGVTVYNPNHNQYKWYQFEKSKNSISHNNVKSIYLDSKKKTIWFGTHLGGLNSFDLEKGIFTNYVSKEGDPSTLPSNVIRDIIPYKHNLIIGTQNGICLFSTVDGKCQQLFKDKKLGEPEMIADLFFDRDSTLWFAVTGYGVYSYRFDTGKLKQFKFETGKKNSISNNAINNIYQSRDGKMWFATSNSGLDSYDISKDEFRNYNSSTHKLKSDCVYQVCESPVTGKLYLITNTSFESFDEKTQLFNSYINIPIHTFNENAMLIDSKGNIFLGGLNGMVSFNESDLTTLREPFNIIPYKLTIDGNTVEVGDDTGILKKALFLNESIAFKCKHTFSIDFQITDFLLRKENDIEYKLEGFSENWTKVNEDNRITYTNLNQGSYRLVIRSLSMTGKVVAEKALVIKIIPPFYKSIFAYIIYIITLIGLAYLVFKMYINRIRLRESLRYEIQRSKDEEELNQSKLNFFTTISHEIKTPLTVIIGQIDSLIQNEQFTTAISKKLKSIHYASGQLRDLVIDLLNFKKQETGMMKLQIAEGNIIVLLTEIRLLYLEYARTRNIRFDFKTVTDEVILWYDGKKLAKVINNILSNSFEHTPNGGWILISLDHTNDAIVINIQDNGSGINLKDIGKIFDNFYQGSEYQLGNGLGLAIAKNIVDLHSGIIEVESELGKGTLFKIYLKKGREHFNPNKVKLADTVDQSVVSAVNESLTIECENDNNAQIYKILLVEDNPQVLELLKDVFENFYTVVFAKDGVEGLQMAKTEMPDIIISDVIMPNMTGIELCKQIKSDLNTCHIPLILLTARAETDQVLEGLINNADDYLVKPFNINILVQKCNNLINSRTMLKEKFSSQPQISVSALATNRMDKEFIDKITKIIEDNLTNPEFNIDSLAMEVGMARTNVYNKMKVITGTTPNKFILMMRLKKASVMLRNNPELSISNIGYLVGFATPRYFSKCFKENYNITPNEYRSGLD